MAEGYVNNLSIETEDIVQDKDVQKISKMHFSYNTDTQSMINVTEDNEKVKSHTIPPSIGEVCYLLNVTQNAWLEAPNNRFTGNFLIVGKAPDYPKKRSLIQFEGLPKNCLHVCEAKMYLYYFEACKPRWIPPEQAKYLKRPLQAYLVKKPWSQHEVTSAYQSDGVRWSKPWLALDGTDAASEPVGGAILPKDCPYNVYLEFNVTEAVRSWHTGVNNYGLLIMATNEDEEGGRDVRFSGMQSQNPPFIMAKCKV